MATASDKGTPIGLTDSTSSSLLDSSILDKGTPIGIKDDTSENTGSAQEDTDAAEDSE
jgi:hypothetical protein